ncbi:MAG TPA: ATP-binding cassette domain-containing protein [Holophagaceae bacterium]
MRDVTFEVAPGEAWGVVGESGSGKTTLLHLVLGLIEPTEGAVRLEGAPWSGVPERLRRPRRARIQAVFQDSQASLPPHRTGWEILAEPLEIQGRGMPISRREAAARMAARVKFPETALAQRPATWSGGLAQRLCLARALMLEPALLVLDEPFSALDPTLASHLLALLLEVKAGGTALLLSSHDLRLMGALCDRTLLLQEGAVLCQGGTGQLLSDPPHPHLRALQEAVPGLARLEGPSAPSAPLGPRH